MRRVIIAATLSLLCGGAAASPDEFFNAQHDFWNVRGWKANDGIARCLVTTRFEAHNGKTGTAGFAYNEKTQYFDLYITNPDWKSRVDQRVRVFHGFDRTREPNKEVLKESHGYFSETTMLKAEGLPVEFYNFWEGYRHWYIQPDNQREKLILSLQGTTDAGRSFMICIGIAAKMNEDVKTEDAPVSGYKNHEVDGWQRELWDKNCDELWEYRNFIYMRAGYCFKSPKAIKRFGNAECKYDDLDKIPLSDVTRDYISTIKGIEATKKCPQ